MPSLSMVKHQLQVMMRELWNSNKHRDGCNMIYLHPWSNHSFSIFTIMHDWYLSILWLPIWSLWLLPRFNCSLFSVIALEKIKKGFQSFFWCCRVLIDALTPVISWNHSFSVLPRIMSGLMLVLPNTLQCFLLWINCSLAHLTRITEVSIILRMLQSPNNRCVH